MRWESYLWNYMSLKNGFRKNLFLTKKLNVAPNQSKVIGWIDQASKFESHNPISGGRLTVSGNLLSCTFGGTVC